MTNLGWPKNSNLRKINRGLLILCLLLNGYVLLAPLFPSVQYVVDTNITKPVHVNASSHSSLSAIDRSGNRVIIPSLQLEETIYEGPDARTLNQGIWHRPASSTPDRGSNTVLAGHRFTYAGPPPFYRLDKLNLGDQVIVVYSHKIYRYRVQTRQTVSPTTLAVESPSSKPELTLYTCTPLWSFTDRLVFKASLEEKL